MIDGVALARKIGSTPTILCVDDEKIVLAGLQEQLRHRLPGFSIEIAESGEEGLEVLTELIEDGSAVPVIISDQLMPEMRGEEFLKQAHTLLPDALTILLTGQASADAVGAAVNEAKLYRYIAKPWGEDDLILTMREALKAWDQARDLAFKDRELRETHAASLRFVPQEFLSALGCERLIDVTEDMVSETDMHVVFADMRSYSSHSLALGSRNAFGLLNEYINILDRVFRAHGGFICGLEGDGVLALFPGSSTDAVAAGIAAHTALNERKVASPDQPIIEMGLAVHRGSVLLGTVGNRDRLKCDVVGNPVNFCARLEALTRVYQTPMLISEQVADAVDPAFTLRPIPKVRIKGQEEHATIIEVLDALPDDLRITRTATLDLFLQAMTELRNGDVETGMRLLAEVRDLDPSDHTAAEILRLVSSIDPVDG